MDSTINIDAYSDALVVLGTAGILVPLLRRWHVNPVLAYLGAGALFGPLGLGSFVAKAPVLYWFTIGNAHNVSGIAELGVVFLLFLIGLGLPFQRLVTMRRLVFGLGGLQVLVTATLAAATAQALGAGASAAIILGASLSLSSTAIVLELLSGQGRLSGAVGRASFAVLLAQDIAVVPILMFVSILGHGLHGSVLATLAMALVQAALALGVIILFGRLLMRPLLRLVASAHSTELFVAAVLFGIVAAGVVANRAGLSMAIGAFVAGLLLAETEHGKAVQATVEPFKGLLLGMFFFTVGMKIDMRELVREPLWLAGCVAALIVGKTLITTGLGRLFRLSWATALETGLLLAPGGEFAFVGVGAANALGLIDDATTEFVLAATSVTMVLTPLLAIAARRLTRLMAAPKSADPALALRPEGDGKRAIVVGHGRVGKVVCALLKEHAVPYVATDSDAIAVTRDRRDGFEVFYGNATDREFLKACGLADATAVIITINAHDVIDQIVALVRAMRPDIPIIARARDAVHARHLYEVGATDAVPETIEASLQLSEAALVGLGIAMGPAIASIHEKRDAFRHELQDAARAAGREHSHAVKRRTLRRG